MTDIFVAIIIGLFIAAMGVINMTGNISTLHRYHRNQVSEENRVPFGRRVGLGTLICGVSVVLYGAFCFASERASNDVLLKIGMVVMTVGLIVGLAISILAIIKYNHKLF